MALVGKVAVVTGAAMGIGRAFAEILLENGATVALLDVNEAAGKTLLEVLSKKYGEERTLFLSCNVESDEQIRAALQKTAETFGGIDILCNNAGILNENDWEKTVAINLVGLIKVTYVALEHMSKLSGGRGGVIVNTASLAGIGPLLSCPVYTATKHGVLGFTRAMALASTASDYGVRINAICPGYVNTHLFNAISGNLGRFSNLAEVTAKGVEKIGIITVSEVAESLLELVKDETKNGDALLVWAKGKNYMTFPSLSQ